MSNPALRFALRYWLIQPEIDGPWPESAASNIPKPPLRWRLCGHKSRWCEWRLGADTEMRELPHDVSISDVQTTSIAWCTEFSTYWITPFDCSNPSLFNLREQQPQKDWSLLYFRNLTNDSSWPRPGLYQALAHGNRATLNFECPPGFEDFLPRQKFRPEPPGTRRPCHLFGKTSLILALYAMCPRNTRDILLHIRRFFFRGSQPRFSPASDQPQWLVRDREGTSTFSILRYNHLALIGYPERALVMQTGMIVDVPDEIVNAYKHNLRLWENGASGPMVSSDFPTDIELQAWQRPQA